MSHEKSFLSYKNFYIQEFEYKRNIRIDKPDNSDSKILDIQPKALISRKDKMFHILLNTIFIDFDLDITVKGNFIGVFEFDIDDDNLLKNFISVNAPAIVFPYIRSLISSFTSQSGAETVILPTLNLLKYKEEILDGLIELDTQI